MKDRASRVVEKFESSLKNNTYNYLAYCNENLIEINCHEMGNVYIYLNAAILEIKMPSGSLIDMVRAIQSNMYNSFQLCVSDDDYFQKSLLSTDVLSVEQTKKILDICDEMSKMKE